MRSLVLGTAGHIDHGKSALVKALTGTDPDRLKEEQERGITIDLGFAHTAIGDCDVSFVDVPGHERFVRTMLAGVGGIDAVVLVVAADESVMPQTREHLAICQLLGIPRGVIALTKADLADSATRAATARDVRSLVGGTALEAAPIHAVSSVTGEGLDALRLSLAALARDRPRLGRGIARLPVDRVFTVKGFGTVVTGTLVSGRIAREDELVLLPEGRVVRVRGVQVHGASSPVAEAPQRAAVNLAGVEVADAARGVTLASKGALPVTRRVDARVEVVAIPGAAGVETEPPSIRHGMRVRVYHGTSELGARLLVGGIRSYGDTEFKPIVAGESTTVGADAHAYVRLRFDRPAVLTRLDRIVLRAYSPAVTIGGGVVLDPEPPAAGLRKPQSLQRFVRLDAISPVPAARVWLEEAGETGLTALDLVRRGAIDPAEAGRTISALVESAGASVEGDRILSAPIAAELARRRAALVAPEPGLSEADQQARTVVEDLLRKGRLTPPDVSIDKAVHGLMKEGRVVKIGDLFFHRDALEELKRGVKAMAEGQSPGAATVDVTAFKAKFGVSRKFAIPLLEWLDRERVTKRVGDRRVVL